MFSLERVVMTGQGRRRRWSVFCPDDPSVFIGTPTDRPFLLISCPFALVLCLQISHLFACPDLPPPSAHTHVRPTLAGFVAYALYRTQLPPSVTTASLLLLARLKARYPQAKGSSGHRL